MLETIIASVIVVAVVGLSSLYIYRAKKRGVKCIGCPAAGRCKSCNGCDHHS